MRRRHAIIATAAGAALLGGVLFTPTAQADEHEPTGPSLCLHLDVSVQDQGDTLDVCLPPEDGGETPALPPAPELPPAPALG